MLMIDAFLTGIDRHARGVLVGHRSGYTWTAVGDCLCGVKRPEWPAASAAFRELGIALDLNEWQAA